MKKIYSSLLAAFLLTVPLASRATTLVNPLGTTDPKVFIGNIIKAVLGLSGAVALLMFVWGGAQWVLSQGEKDKIEKGRKTIVWAALGLCFVFLSYALLYNLLRILGGVA
jgi:cytochrome bd-type quinol oxidase subunit 2